MKRHFPTKTKLLISMFVLVSILIFLAAIIIEEYSSKINSLGVLNEKISLSKDISNLIHSLQKERGLSSGYISSINGTFTHEMFEQRKQSDLLIKKLLGRFKIIQCKDLTKNIKNVKSEIEKLSTVRREVDLYETSPDKIIQEYSKINRYLLDMIISIAKTSDIPTITQNILTYTYLLYYKEYLGMQRAQGVILLSMKKFDKESFTKFVNFMAIAKQNERMFFTYAPESLRKYFLTHTNTKEFVKVRELENKIISSDENKYKLDSKIWYNEMTKKLNILDKISQYIEKETQNEISSELHHARIFFMIVIFLLAGSWLIFLYIMLHILKLMKNEQRLRLVMDKYVISSITDLRGIIIDVSQAFCDISGYNKEELIGKNHNIVRHPDMPRETFAKLWKQIKTGESWSGKVKNKRKDGSAYWVYANIEPLYNQNKKLESYISIRMDITETELLNQKIKEEEERNKRQEEVMRQQHRLAQMGEMIAMIAHQWRQPLSAITAASGAIMLKASRNTLDAQKAIELSSKIQEFSKHLSTTIDDFRNFFKSNKQKTTTDFKKISESVLSILEDSLVKSNIEIETEYKDIEAFNAYENELKQVLLNLIKNSEDALNEKNITKKKIMLSVENKCIKISDNAGGIDEEILPKIFDPYFSTKTKKDGTGLGLYMSKVIIEDHCDGLLKVENIEEGVMFEIILGEKND